MEEVREEAREEGAEDPADKAGVAAPELSGEVCMNSGMLAVDPRLEPGPWRLYASAK